MAGSLPREGRRHGRRENKRCRRGGGSGDRSRSGSRHRGGRGTGNSCGNRSGNGLHGRSCTHSGPQIRFNPGSGQRTSGSINGHRSGDDHFHSGVGQPPQGHRGKIPIRASDGSRPTCTEVVHCRKLIPALRHRQQSNRGAALPSGDPRPILIRTGDIQRNRACHIIRRGDIAGHKQQRPRPCQQGQHMGPNSKFPVHNPFYGAPNPIAQGKSVRKVAPWPSPGRLRHGQAGTPA